MQEQTQMYSQQTGPVKKKNNGVAKFFGVFFLVIFILSICGFLPLIMILGGGGNSDDSSVEYGENNLTYSYSYGDEGSDNRLVEIYVDSAILTSAQDYSSDLLTALLYGNYVFGYQIKDQLISLSEDSSVKGVLLHINSPGGTVAGARAIADGVKYYQDKTGNPVYAYVQDMAASGAYWAAVSTDQIVAEKGSLVGSIGVIMGPFEYYDNLVQLNGVGATKGITITYITAGKSKDLGNPTRKMTEEELNILQTGVDSEYDGFVEYVSKQRGIPENRIREDIRALVYGTREALENNMIDKAANWHETVDMLATEAGVVDSYKVVRLTSSSSLFGSLWAKLTTPDIEPKVENKCVLCNKMLYFYGDPYSY